MINYSEEFSSAYDELQKAIKDRSHLMQKVITDKNGHSRKVWVKTEEKNTVKTDKKIDSKVTTKEDYAKKYLKEFNTGKHNVKEWAWDEEYKHGEQQERLLHQFHSTKDSEKRKQIEVKMKDLNNKTEGLALATRMYKEGKSFEEKKNVKTVGKIDDSSLNDEIRETYNDVLEWLNPYDRTDPDETTKYREAFESLSKRYSKEMVAQDYKSMKSKMNDKESFSKLINSIPNIRDDRSYKYQILYNAIKNTKKENLDHILDKIENMDGSIDKQKLVDVLFPPEPPKKESASKTEIDKLILSASKKDDIKNAIKKYITDNPTKKDSIIDYISKKHDEVLSKYRDASMYFRYAKTKEEKEKYTKELNKYDKLVDMYGYARYYDQ